MQQMPEALPSSVNRGRIKPWEPARITRSEALSPDIRLLEIAPLRGVEAFVPGAHIQLRVELPSAEGVIQATRHYSLVEDASAHGVYRIAVKRLANGRGGSLHLWHSQEGDEIHIRPPLNYFPLSYSADDYLLIAGGIGVTPIHAMATALAKSGKRLRMFYAAANAEQLVFAQGLRELLGERLTLIDGGDGARLDIPAALATLPADGEAYLCGPLPMMEAVRAEWQRQQRPVTALRFESFANTGRYPTTSFSVAIDNLGVSLVVPEHKSLLEVMREHGIEALFDCERGECGLCAVEVTELEGQLDHRDVYLSETQRQRGRQMCCCVSRVSAAGRIVIDTRRQGVL